MINGEPTGNREIPISEINNKVSVSVDFIPSGTFSAIEDENLTGDKIKAIQLVEEYGRNLVSSHPEIAEIYKDPSLRLIDIAKEVFPPEEIEKFPAVCSHAVGWAIRYLNPQLEQTKLTHEHRSYNIKLQFDFKSPEFSKQCQEASKVRHEKHGVDTEVMIRARGREPWNLAERAMVRDLTVNPNFQHQGGSIKGWPDYEKIAYELNHYFHNDKVIRTANSVGSLVRDSRRKKREVGV